MVGGGVVVDGVVVDGWGLVDGGLATTLGVNVRRLYPSFCDSITYQTRTRWW